MSFGYEKSKLRRRFYTCPRCGNKGRWRTGAHFDNEKICFCENFEDAISWCPYEPDEWQKIKDRFIKEVS